MNSKISKILLPTTVAFLAFVGLISLESKFHNQIFPSIQDLDDGAESFSNLLLIYALILPYLFCLFFQGLIILPFWIKINSVKKIRGLNFWQIVGLSTLIIFVIIFLIGLLEGYEIRLLLLDCFIFLLMFIVYWTVNFLTLKIIDKTECSSQQRHL